jgi:hypothetical protein|tara:strand:+ start:144 stop:311 length:168 start_codon:yes stop_codon:yes gene_type:complete
MKYLAIWRWPLLPVLWATTTTGHDHKALAKVVPDDVLQGRREETLVKQREVKLRP